MNYRMYSTIIIGYLSGEIVRIRLNINLHTIKLLIGLKMALFSQLKLS